MSGTTGIFSKFERDELNKITAKSILEKLMNIRQHINVEFTAKRLIWELMQNAKDNASLCNEDGEKVDVKIQLTEGKFIFSHNKGYFTNEHIRGLIRKYSSSDKDRDGDQVGQVYKTIGRFGTGFMTTHLLSEKVQVKSFYKNDDQTFSPFSFWLDRTGKTEPKIIEGINNAFDQAEESIKKSEKVRLTKKQFNTSFIYPLTEQKKNLANISLEEVNKGIAYTLLNVPEINSVTIEEDLIGETVYQIDFIGSIHGDCKFDIYNLLIDGNKSKKYYLTVNEGDIQLIVPIAYRGSKYYAMELDATIPRLHLDFPMIGTEGLNTPFVVNSPLFEPTEPRDGVSLIDDGENEFLQMNCNLVLKAASLYKSLLDYAGQDLNWNDLYNLARIKPPHKYSWIDQDWFKENIVSSVREKLLHTPIVHVVSGERISILDEDDEHLVYFPYADKDSIRETIWSLAKMLHPHLVPVKEHIDYWNEIIWSACYKFSITEVSREIHNLETVSALATALNADEAEAIHFLNRYYKLLNVEKNHISDILTNKFSVIPNQHGEFKPKGELMVDENIDEELKNACSKVGQDPREYLVGKNISTGDGVLYTPKQQNEIIVEINNILKENKHERISEVCDYLASLFPKKDIPGKRTSIFDFSKRLYPDDFSAKRKLTGYDERIWEESDKKSIFYIVSEIAQHETVERACEELDFSNKQDFVVWLDTFVTFLVKEGFGHNINREKHPILPNQNGVFCTKDNLFLDEGDIGEILKDISGELGYDFRTELLDSAIFLELPENRTYDISNVAEKIASLLKPILRDIDERKEHKTSLKRFYLWMNENREKAETHFVDLFEKRFLFLEDDDISLNMKKASEFDELMEEHGIADIAELRTRLANLPKSTDDTDDSSAERINITKEILVSLGISSPEQLEEALKDPAISERFYHTSTPTTEMFIYAQTLIERAKQNITAFLEDHDDYDCTDMEETAPTTLMGITKKGEPVQIVTRPSDNGEVIIYYSSEKDTLDSESSELWVDNGKTAPHILTLGRILKSTGINRIPINMNK